MGHDDLLELDHDVLASVRRNRSAHFGVSESEIEKRAELRNLQGHGDQTGFVLRAGRGRCGRAQTVRKTKAMAAAALGVLDMGVPGFSAEKLPTSTGIGPSQMALGVAMADVRLARVSGDYGRSVVSDSISGVLAAIRSSDGSGQPKSHATNVPEIVRTVI